MPDSRPTVSKSARARYAVQLLVLACLGAGLIAQVTALKARPDALECRGGARAAGQACALSGLAPVVDPNGNPAVRR